MCIRDRCTYSDRESPSDDIRLRAVEYSNVLVRYYDVIKLFDHPFCHTISPHTVTSKGRSNQFVFMLLMNSSSHIHLPGNFVVALPSVDVVSLKSKPLKGRNRLQHLVHIGRLELHGGRRWLRWESVVLNGGRSWNKLTHSPAPLQMKRGPSFW